MHRANLKYANLEDSGQRGANLAAAVMLNANVDFADMWTFSPKPLFLGESRVAPESRTLKGLFDLAGAEYRRRRIAWMRSVGYDPPRRRGAPGGKARDAIVSSAASLHS